MSAGTTEKRPNTAAGLRKTFSELEDVSCSRAPSILSRVEQISSAAERNSIALDAVRVNDMPVGKKRMPSNHAAAILDADMANRSIRSSNVKRLLAWMLLAAAAAGLACQKRSRYADVPRKAIPEFEISTPEGSLSLSRAVPPGGVAVLFFGYRGCPDICSSTLRRIGQAHLQLSTERQNRTKTIFIEIGQTPLAEAAAYARAFDSSMGAARDPDGRITRALDIYRHPVENAQPMRIEHSGTIILADHNLISRKRLPHDISAEDLAYEIEVILAEENR